MRIKFLKADHGDSIIVSFNKKNILIDGGVSGCYYDANSNTYGELRYELDAMRSRGERVDLLILTHIDNDHICGLLKWFEMDDKASDLISEIWFNSARTISEALAEIPNIDLKVFINIDSSLTGFSEALEFEDYVTSKNIWNQKIWTSGMTYRDPDFKIEIISPGQKQLRNLVRDYKVHSSEPTTTGSRSTDWGRNVKAIIDEELISEFKFDEDRSVKNGSSIAFVLSVGGLKFLFLGDAHPTVILNGLLDLGYNKANPLKVEIVKLSHHGSNKNTSAQLLDVISSENYFISTNGEYHSHPGKRTIARILKRNSKSKFFFNYEGVIHQVFNKMDRDSYQINAVGKSEFYFV